VSTGFLERSRTMQSFIGWVGGKKKLSKTLVALIPGHTCYVEPFGGAGWVLFAKEPSKVEVYNDLDSRLVNLFRCVKYHPKEVCREFQFLLGSREIWNELREQPGLTDIQRAGRFFFVLRQSVANKAATWGYSRRNRFNAFPLEKLMVDMEVIRHRLERVTIEHRDFGRILPQFDTPETFCYLDPPYYGCESCYQVRFSEEDHARLHAAVEGLVGRWLMTYNDTEWGRETYRACNVYEVEAPYSVSVGSGHQPGPQLIITNYALTADQLAAAPRDVTPVHTPIKGGSKRRRRSTAQPRPAPAAKRTHKRR